MEQRAFLGALAGGLVATPLVAEAQPRKMYRIEVLFPETRASVLCVRACRILDGRKVPTLCGCCGRSAEGDPERLSALAAQLVNIPVDIIVAATVQASLAAKRVTSRIPIVSVYTFDPVEVGLVASLARPGGNVTGLSAMASEYLGKMLQVLREVAPRADRVAVLSPVQRKKIG